MDMDPPHLSDTKPIMISLSMFVLGMIKPKRKVYNSNIDSTHVDYSPDVSDFVPDSPYVGIDLPPDEFYQIHALSSRHSTPHRPGNPSKPPFRPQSQQSAPQKSFKSYDALSICHPKYLNC